MGSFLDGLKGGVGKTLGICLGVVIILVVIGLVISHGGSSSNSGSSATAPLQSMHSLNEAFNVGDLSVVISNLKHDTQVNDGIQVTKARTGAEYIIFDATAMNNGKTSASFYSGDLKVRDSQGREFDVAGGIDSDGRIITDTNIEPGLSASYKSFYAEVPSGSQELILAVYDNGVWKTGEQDVKLSG